jgi:hypothetical protein
MKERVKQFWQSRIGFGVVCFILGGILTYLFLPEKTIVKIEKVIEYKDKIIEKVVTKWKTKTVEVEKQISKTKHTVKWPDGKEESWEVFESNTQQVTRIEEQYKDLMTQKETEWSSKYSKLEETIGRKHFSLFGGMGTNPANVGKPKYQAGITADMWGPLQLGISVNTNPDIFFNVGLRF